MLDFKVGDRVQYNKKYLESEVCQILEIQRPYCLVIFPSGIRLCTRLGGLWKINKNNL